MSNSIQFTYQATDSQVEQFELNQGMIESLMASTLKRRLLRAIPEEYEAIICDWFKSVRHMAIANHAMAGIKFEIVNPAGSQ